MYNSTWKQKSLIFCDQWQKRVSNSTGYSIWASGSLLNTPILIPKIRDRASSSSFPTRTLKHRSSSLHCPAGAAQRKAGLLLRSLAAPWNGLVFWAREACQAWKQPLDRTFLSGPLLNPLHSLFFSLPGKMENKLCEWFIYTRVGAIYRKELAWQLP